MCCPVFDDKTLNEGMDYPVSFPWGFYLPELSFGNLTTRLPKLLLPEVNGGTALAEGSPGRLLPKLLEELDYLKPFSMLLRLGWSKTS